MNHQTVNIETEKEPAFELIPAIVRQDRKKTQCLLNSSYEAVIIEFYHIFHELVDLHMIEHCML